MINIIHTAESSHTAMAPIHHHMYNHLLALQAMFSDSRSLTATTPQNKNAQDNRGSVYSTIDM
jgi:hypothetical protein